MINDHPECNVYQARCVRIIATTEAECGEVDSRDPIDCLEEHDESLMINMAMMMMSMTMVMRRTMMMMVMMKV